MNAAELASVTKAQLPAARDLKYRVVVTAGLVTIRNQAQVAAHTQVDKQRQILELDDDVLATPFNSRDPPIAQPGVKFIQVRLHDMSGPGSPDRQDPPADQRGR